MSEVPRWGRGGLCSNRLDEFSMTGTAEKLNRTEFHRGSCQRTRSGTSELSLREAR